MVIVVQGKNDGYKGSVTDAGDDDENDNDDEGSSSNNDDEHRGKDDNDDDRRMTIKMMMMMDSGYDKFSNMSFVSVLFVLSTR